MLIISDLVSFEVLVMFIQLPVSMSQDNHVYSDWLGHVPVQYGDVNWKGSTSYCIQKQV